MAQYKKDEIKAKIDFAALIVFSEKGYDGTKIFDVAAKAGISVGNVYRYYKSKEEMFYSILPESFLISVKKLLEEKIAVIKDENLEIPNEIDKLLMFNDDFVLFMVENRERILILFNNSKGTKYENVREDLLDFILKSVKETYSIKCNEFIKEENIDLVLKIIYENAMAMTLNILMASNNIQEVKDYMKTINSYHMFGITSLFR